LSGNLARRAFEAVRSVIFWCHLAAGTAAGVVVLIMSVTGVLLAYQRQMLEQSAGRHRVSPPPAGAHRLPLDSLVANARGTAGGQRVGGLTIRADSLMPVSVTLEDRSSLFLHPYTAEVLGGDAGLRAFFSTVERVHRSIVFEGATRSEAGTAVTGAANLAFLFLVLSGLVLWWPRRWSRGAFRQVLLFSHGARGKARDWNWHHVLGLWSAPVLVLIVVSAAYVSYDWPQRLVERAFGQSAPSEGGGRGRERGSGADERPRLSLDTVLARAIGPAAAWHSIQLRLPSEAGRPISVTISHTPVFRPDQRSSVTLDGGSGAVAERRMYQDLDPARRLRAWMRPLHTGEVGGIAGQTVAAIVSAAAAVLVWTGLALAWRRLRAAMRRRETEHPSLVAQRPVPDR